MTSDRPRPRTSEEWDAEIARVTAEEQPILADLRRVGLDVASTSDIDRKNLLPEVVPILLDHLARPYDPGIRDMIARALGTPAARPIWRTLADLFVAEQDYQVKQGLACAVADTASDDTLDELLALIADPRIGPDRVLLLHAKFPARALGPLERLADDPDLRLEMPRVLKRLRRTPRAGGAGPPTPVDPALAEASSGFDRETVPAFLRRLVSLGVGFRRAEAKAVQRMVDDLDEDDERELRFDLATDRGPEPLVVRAFQDDPDAVDLYFFGPAHLAAVIQGEMARLEPPGIDS
jgi:hypothetical protein